jgi:hypothetical protein
VAEDEDFEPRVPVTNEPVGVAEGKLPEWTALVSKSVVPPTGDRGFESFFLQRRVRPARPAGTGAGGSSPQPGVLRGKQDERSYPDCRATRGYGTQVARGSLARRKGGFLNRTTGLHETAWALSEPALIVQRVKLEGRPQSEKICSGEENQRDVWLIYNRRFSKDELHSDESVHLFRNNRNIKPTVQRARA